MKSIIDAQDTLYANSSIPSVQELNAVITGESFSQISATNFTAQSTIQDLQNNKLRIQKFAALLATAASASQKLCLKLSLSFLYILVAYQARQLGQHGRDQKQWLDLAFQNLHSIHPNEFFYISATIGICAIYDHSGYRGEEKLSFILQLIQKNSERAFFIQRLFNTILRDTFSIKKQTSPLHFQGVERCLIINETTYLHSFYGRGLNEDVLFKLSLLTYALNCIFDLAGSSCIADQIRITRCAILEQLRDEVVELFKTLRILANIIFQEEKFKALRQPFRAIMNNFKQAAEKIRLFKQNSNGSLRCQTITNQILIIAGIKIRICPISDIQAYRLAFTANILVLSNEDEQQLLHYISQQYAKGHFDQARRTVASSEVYINHFREPRFPGENALIQFIPLCLGQWPEQSASNMYFLLYKLQSLIASPLPSIDKARMSIYYLVLCKKLSFPNNVGIAALRECFSYMGSEVHHLPQNKSLSKAIADSLQIASSHTRKAMVGHLIDSISQLDPTLTEYFKFTYLGDRQAKTIMLRRAIDCICCLYYYLFTEKAARPSQDALNFINLTLQRQDLIDITQKYEASTGDLAGDLNRFISGRGHDIEAQFLEFRVRKEECLRRRELPVRHVALRQQLDETVLQSKRCLQTRRKIRQCLGKRFSYLLKHSVLVEYCLNSLATHLSPSSKQKILQFGQSQLPLRLIRKIAQMFDIDESTLAYQYRHR